jgi:hypothetical protein
MAGHTIYYHKTNDVISRELQTEVILDMIDEYKSNCLYTCKECQTTESL